MLILLIKIYRLLIKRHIKSACLFNTSCSCFVENEYRNKGALAGWKALKVRYYDCRPGYRFILINGNAVLITAAGNTYSKDELSYKLKEVFEKEVRDDKSSQLGI